MTVEPYKTRTLIRVIRCFFPPSILHHVRVQQEVDSLQCRRGLSPEPDHAGMVISDLQFFRTVRNIFQFFISHPIYGIYVTAA